MAARYREIADDLRNRIGSGEFALGSQLPTIAALMRHYAVPGQNTVRQAQQLLADDGMVEARQGVGVFVMRSEPDPKPVDVLAELRGAQVAIERAITALERAGRTTDGVAARDEAVR